MAKPNAVHRLPLVLEFEGQMFLAHQSLRQNLDLFAECRRGKALAPYLFVQHIHQFDPAVFRFQRAIGIQTAGKGGGVQLRLTLMSISATTRKRLAY